MNIAEYIEQNMRKNGRKFTVIYSQFVKDVGLKDVHTAREWIETDLQELFKCRYIKNNVIGAFQSCLIEELFFAKNYVQIDFSIWIHEIREDNPHWLSDILQQTRMNNYIVIGE